MTERLTDAVPALSTQKALLLKRDERLRARFTELYKTKRMRLDDVMHQLETEFFISQRTIRGLLKAENNA